MKNVHLDLQKQPDILQNSDILKQTWRFVPKHLIVIKNQEKKGIQGGMLRKLKDKDATYQLSTMEIINENKNLYLGPVRDIQKIMKHFSRKFDDFSKSKEDDKMGQKKGKKGKGPIKNRRRKSTQLKAQNGQELIQNKISKLLQLPTIKRVNSQAQKIKTLNMERSTKKQQQKQQILRKFELYFSRETDLISTKNLQSTIQYDPQAKYRRRRVKTSIQ